MLSLVYTAPQSLMYQYKIIKWKPYFHIRKILHDNKTLHNSDNTLKTVDAKMELSWLKCHFRKIKKIKGYIVFVYTYIFITDRWGWLTLSLKATDAQTSPPAPRPK